MAVVGAAEGAAAADAHKHTQLKHPQPHIVGTLQWAHCCHICTYLHKRIIVIVPGRLALLPPAAHACSPEKQGCMQIKQR